MEYQTATAEPGFLPVIHFCIAFAYSRLFLLLMRRPAALIYFLLFTLIANSQTYFKTIVSSGPYVVDESFNVQYLFEESSKEDRIMHPDFGVLHVLRGPEEGPANITGPRGTRNLRSIVYTLIAPRTGKFIIPSIGVNAHGKVSFGE